VSRSVRKTVREMEGEMIVAVIDQHPNRLIPVAKDEASIALSVIALLQFMRAEPIFRADHATIDRFLDEFGVGRFKDVSIVRLKDGPPE
jgi:hypothetical protein